MAGELCYIQTYRKVILAEVRRDRLLDGPSISELGEILGQIPEKNPKCSLVLDLSRVSAMSSQMLGKLVALHKSVKTNKGRMCIAGIQKSIKPLFKTTRLDRLFQLADDPQEMILFYQRKPL